MIFGPTLAVVLSMDATFRAALKAAMVNADKEHDAPMKGGILSMLNEFNECIDFVCTTHLPDFFTEVTSSRRAC